MKLKERKKYCKIHNPIQIWFEQFVFTDYYVFKSFA